MTVKQIEAVPPEDRGDISRGRRNGRVTPELIKKVRETYAAGRRYGDIAAENGVSYVTVRNIVKGLHPLQRDPSATPAPVSEDPSLAPEA